MMMLIVLKKRGKEGKEFKAPRYASAATTCDYIITRNIIPNRYFIAYIKEILIEDIAQVYIKEVFLKYKVLDKIILDKDIRFISAF